MTPLLIAGPVLTLALLLLVLALLHLGSGPDQQERERFRRAAELEGIRQEMRTAWANGPVTRRRPNRHDRAHGRRRDYTGVA